MTKQVRDFFPQGINMYVPAMQFASSMGYNLEVYADLGSPTGYDEDGINNDGDGDPTVNTVVWAASFTVGGSGIGSTTDAVYGQNLVMKVSGDPGAGGVDVDVYGEDYLGQPMVETLTTANGATAAVEGTKAFQRIIKYVVPNPAANNITFDLGWGTKLGLPYKLGNPLGSVENGQPSGGADAKAQRTVAGVDAGAGVVAGSVTAPFDGYIIGNAYEVTTAQATAAATLDAVVAGIGQSTLDLVVPVAAIGLSGINMLAKASWIAVSEGDTITFTSDNGGDTGVVAVTVFFARPEGDWAMPDATDPATKTTDDPRGLYDPQLAPNGTREYKVHYIADNSTNTDGNGGLHGIQHYIA